MLRNHGRHPGRRLISIALGCVLIFAGFAAAPVTALNGPERTLFQRLTFVPRPTQAARVLAPSAADFTLDQRVMLRSDFLLAQSCAKSGDSIAVTYGADVVYCYLFTNTGSTTFVLHTIEGSQVDPFSPDPQPRVAPGERSGYAALPAAPVTADLTNAGTWTATDESGTTVVRTDTVTVKVLMYRAFLPLIVN
jgi:hypothetical protein